jgi:hypothetical protein
MLQPYHDVARLTRARFVAPLHGMQAPVPLQDSLPMHSASGSVPAGMGAHVPLFTPVFGIEHAWHMPEQASLQHTPSTQKPVAQSLALPHG